MFCSKIFGCFTCCHNLCYWLPCHFLFCHFHLVDYKNQVYVDTYFYVWCTFIRSFYYLFMTLLKVGKKKRNIKIVAKKYNKRKDQNSHNGIYATHFYNRTCRYNVPALFLWVIRKGAIAGIGGQSKHVFTK